MLKVGFLGPEGTFCEEASSLYLNKIGKKLELIPYSTIHDLMHAVDQKKLDEGIVPLENSVEGTVNIVLDILISEVNLKIYQEIILPVRHFLMSPRGTTLKKITDVISHPQAIDQCKKFLRTKLRKAEIHLAYSTADAAQEVALGLEGEAIPRIVGYHYIASTKNRVFAAIGTRAAAKMYGLKIIASNVHDYIDNATRFIALSKKDHAPTSDDKTSIVFSALKDRPGALHQILEEFAKRKINLTKIESRPSKRALGDYFFYIDLQGHRKDKIVAEALAAVQRQTAFMKILGSYPRAKH